MKDVFLMIFFMICGGYIVFFYFQNFHDFSYVIDMKAGYIENLNTPRLEAGKKGPMAICAHFNGAIELNTCECFVRPAERYTHAN